MSHPPLLINVKLEVEVAYQSCPVSGLPNRFRIPLMTLILTRGPTIVLVP